MSGPVFATPEREAIDAAFAEAEDALAPEGLWPGRRDAIHLAHHRAVARRARGRRGRKIPHGQIAAAALAYAREVGEIRLYAAMAIAAAVSARFEPRDSERAAQAWPCLREGSAALGPFIAGLRGAAGISRQREEGSSAA